jgi:hypothetical protein
LDSSNGKSQVCIGTASSTLDITTGQIVEVGFDMKYPKEDSYKLRFPKILRVREDKTIKI